MEISSKNPSPTKQSELSKVKQLLLKFNPYSILHENQSMIEFTLLELSEDQLFKSLHLGNLQEQYIIGLLYIRALRDAKQEIVMNTINQSIKRLFKFEVFEIMVQNIDYLTDTFAGSQLSEVLAKETHLFFNKLKLETNLLDEQLQLLVQEWEQQAKLNSNIGAPMIVDTWDNEEFYYFQSAYRDNPLQAFNYLKEILETNFIYKSPCIAELFDSISIKIDRFLSNQKLLGYESSTVIDLITPVAFQNLSSQIYKKVNVEEEKLVDIDLNTPPISFSGDSNNPIPISSKNNNSNIFEEDTIQNEYPSNDKPEEQNEERFEDIPIEEESNLEGQTLEKQKIPSPQIQQSNLEGIGKDDEEIITIQQNISSLNQENKSTSQIPEVEVPQFDINTNNIENHKQLDQDSIHALIELIDSCVPFDFSTIFIDSNFIIHSQLEDFVEQFDTKNIKPGHKTVCKTVFPPSINACKEYINYQLFFHKLLKLCVAQINQIQSNSHQVRLFNSLKQSYFHFNQFRLSIQQLIYKSLKYFTENPSQSQILIELLFPSVSSLMSIAEEIQDDSFKEILKSDQVIQQIIEQALALHPPSVEMNTIIVKSGVPEFMHLGAGFQSTRFFQVTKPLSVINFSIAVQYYDISVQIKYHGNFQRLIDDIQNLREGIILVNLEKLDCTVDPYRGNLLALQTGIYSFDFINEYSWFNAKDIRYRINVLDSINVFDPFTYPIRKLLYPFINDESSEIQAHLSSNSPKDEYFVANLADNSNILTERYFRGPFRIALYVTQKNSTAVLSCQQNISEIYFENIEVQSSLEAVIFPKLKDAIKKRFENIEELFGFKSQNRLEILIIRNSQVPAQLFDPNESLFVRLLKTIANNVDVTVRIDVQILIQNFNSQIVKKQIHSQMTTRLIFLFDTQDIVYFFLNLQQVQVLNMSEPPSNTILAPVSLTNGNPSQYQLQILSIQQHIINYMLQNCNELLDVYFVNLKSQINLLQILDGEVKSDPNAEILNFLRTFKDMRNQVIDEMISSGNLLQRPKIDIEIADMAIDLNQFIK